MYYVKLLAGVVRLIGSRGLREEMRREILGGERRRRRRGDEGGEETKEGGRIITSWVNE
jgi:hypothetical protein